MHFRGLIQLTMHFGNRIATLKKNVPYKKQNNFIVLNPSQHIFYCPHWISLKQQQSVQEK